MKEERFKQVADKPGLVKDTATGAILNTDANALEAYKKQKANFARTSERLDKLETDISEIKEMLNFIAGRLK